MSVVYGYTYTWLCIAIVLQQFSCTPMNIEATALHYSTQTLSELFASGD
jgi:hypothetical protein